MIHEELARDEAWRARFKREARVLASLQPNIPPRRRSPGCSTGAPRIRDLELRVQEPPPAAAPAHANAAAAGPGDVFVVYCLS